MLNTFNVLGVSPKETKTSKNMAKKTPKKKPVKKPIKKASDTVNPDPKPPKP